MSNIMELIETALRISAEKSTAASIWSDSSAERREYCDAYDEARTAVIEAVDKLERDAAMLSRVIVMHPDDPAIGHLDGVLVYVQRTLPKMEATNGQGT